MTDTAPIFQVPADVLAQYGDWTECAAFRFVKVGDEYRLEVSNDLEAITRPAEDA